MGWVLFRSETFAGAGDYYAALFGAGPVIHPQPWLRYASREVILTLCLGAAFSMPAWAAIKSAVVRRCEAASEKLRGACYVFARLIEFALVMALLILSATGLAGGTYNPFIYFRF
jgi:alginate O-acetyltransferase complex protein AlgI